MSDSETKIIHTTGCNNCGGRCAIHCHVRDGRIVRITTDTPEAAGDAVPLIACARGLNYHKTYVSDQRLLYPMKRVGRRGEGRFERISWDEAIDTIEREWVRIRDTYGPLSRFVLYATGGSKVLSGREMTKRLLSLDGGFLNYYNSYSTACVRAITPYLYGDTMTGNSPADWLNTSLIVLWGHNPAETVFDAETMYYLRKCKAKGIPVIGIDPRRTATMKILGADWYPIRPATDSALADALAYVLYTSGRYDKAFIKRCCIGFDKASMPEGIDPSECYFSYLTGEKDGVPKTPEWAEAITGLAVERIRELADRMAQAKPMNILQGWGPQRNGYGEQATRAAIMLTCLTGNVGISGGSACGTGDWSVHRQAQIPPVPNPTGCSIPTFLWTTAVRDAASIRPVDGLIGRDRLNTNVKMLLNIAGNTLLNQHSDTNATRKLLEDESKVEFILVSDVFMTASAKYADILLPATSFLEEDNVANPWGSGNMIGFANKVIEPLGECRPEYDWLKELAGRLGLYEEFTEGHETMLDWLSDVYEQLRKEETELPEFDVFRRDGIYRYRNNPVRIAFREECEDPVKHPFPTPSGKIEIFSERLFRMEHPEPFPAIPRYMPAPDGIEDPVGERYPLQLIGWHSKRSCHSIHYSNKGMDSLTRGAVYMNPADAAKRGLSEGQMTVVYNDHGKVVLPAAITADIMPGVCAIPAGRWYRPDRDGTDRGGCINTLTSQHPTPLAHGNPQHTNRVECRAELSETEPRS